MQEIFEKIKEWLEAEKEKAIDMFDNGMGYKAYSNAIRIANQVAEECNLSKNSTSSDDGWIPCSERLPEDEEQEYILCVNGKCGNITYDHAVLAGSNYYEDGKWYIDGALKKNVEVLAWMPLPVPYQPKGE